MTSTLRWCAAVAIATVALSGCVRATVDTTINADDTFSQASIVAVSESASRQLDQLPELPQGQQLPTDLDLDALLDDAASAPALLDLQERYPGQVDIADYDDGELSGIEITLTDLPLDEFDAAGQQAAGALGAQAALDEVDGQYVITMSPPPDLDLGAAGITDSTLALIENSVEIAVTFTFPGLVQEASAGEVDGNTVTLGLTDLASGEEIEIVADADPAIDWGPWLEWGGVALAFVLVIGGATALVIQDQRKRRRSTLPPPQASSSPAGPGMLSAPDEDPDPTPGTVRDERN